MSNLSHHIFFLFRTVILISFDPEVLKGWPSSGSRGLGNANSWAPPPTYEIGNSGAGLALHALTSFQGILRPLMSENHCPHLYSLTCSPYNWLTFDILHWRICSCNSESYNQLHPQHTAKPMFEMLETVSISFI